MAVATPEITAAYNASMSEKGRGRSLRWSPQPITEHFPNLETYLVDTTTLATVGGLLMSGVTGLTIEMTSPRLIHSVMSPEHLPTLIAGTAAGAVIGGVIGWVSARREAYRRFKGLQS